MGQQLVDKLLTIIAKIDWPQAAEATDQGLQAYMLGLERLDEYDGDPKMLSAALRAFQMGASWPYACAGIAATLVVAAAERDGRYAANGLAEAMNWLEKAQEAAPDVVEINATEALIYIYNGRGEDARLVLDYLQELDPANYQVSQAEIAYWQQQGNNEETINWFNRTAEAATTVPQRLRTRARLGDYYLRQNLLAEALAIYKEAVHFDKKNVALWHKISKIYWDLGDLNEATLNNQQTLRLQADYEPALALSEALKKKKPESGRLRRLFG